MRFPGYDDSTWNGCSDEFVSGDANAVNILLEAEFWTTSIFHLTIDVITNEVSHQAE